MTPRGASGTRKPLEWVGTTKDLLRDMPPPVRSEFGYALFLAQLGEAHPHAHPMKGDLRAVMEYATTESDGTYRVMYTTKLAGVVYVLHVFQKKSTRGIATPRRELDAIRARLRAARAIHRRHYTAG